MPYNTVYVWAAYETLGSTNLNANMANLGYLKTKADRAIWPCKVFFPTQSLVAGDAKYGFSIPEDLDGYDLSGIAAKVWTQSSSGLVSIMLRNATQGVDMLSTPLTIDANKKSSSTAATPVVIDTDNDDVAADDEIYIDVDSIGTGTKGLQVTPVFYLT